MYNISNSVYVFLVLTAVLATIIPVALLVIWKVKTKEKLMPALVGAIIFVLFALGLESIPKYFLFTGANDVSKYVLSHAWAYTVIGCLLAGIFEETGRFVAFRFFLKKYENKTASIMYGIGHGGIEAIILLSAACISYIGLAMMMQNGGIDAMLATLPADQVEKMNATLLQVSSFGAIDGLLAILERICAIALHISLSIVVFISVKQKGKGWLFPVAIVVHAIFDVPAAMYQFGVVSMVGCEIWLLIETAVIAVFAYRIYKKL